MLPLLQWSEALMADESEAALELVGEYAKAEGKKTAGDHLKRYAATSGKFAAVGGAVGSVFPGVGTALGGLVGAGAGVLWEGGSDLIDALTEDGPKRVNESPEKAEKAFYAYQALGGERATLMPYEQWWKLYVAAGRPPLEVLQATQEAERAAAKELKRRGKPVPAPPPPPPPRAGVAGVAGVASGAAVSQAGAQGIRDGATTALMFGVPLAGVVWWLIRRK